MLFSVQWISQEEQERLDQQVEEYRTDLKKKEEDIFALNEQEIRKLKEEIEELRESRSKLRSHVTIYPAAASPEVEEGQGTELGLESSLEDQVAGGQAKQETVTLAEDGAGDSNGTSSPQQSPQEHTAQ